MSLRISFNIVRDGKYHAVLHHVAKAASQYGEQLCFTFALYKSPACKGAPLGALKQYFSFTPKLYEFMQSLGWPKLKPEGVELQTGLHDRIAIPSPVNTTRFHIEVTTEKTKQGKLSICSMEK